MLSLAAEPAETHTIFGKDNQCSRSSLTQTPERAPTTHTADLQTSRAVLRKKKRFGLLIERRLGAAFYRVPRTRYVVPPPTCAEI